jgi:type IX secretion system PorP/SprF family membrane protein
MRKLRHIALVLLFIVSIRGFAQDAQFTQFYAAPIYLNPAYTGVTYEHRFIANYRNQWLGIAKAYQTFACSYDYNMPSLNSGFGLMVMRDAAGSSRFTTTSIGGSYAYHFMINKFREMRMGIQFNYVSKGIDYTKLVFNDQLLVDGAAVSPDAAVLGKANYLDLAAGILENSTEYWLGFSAHHINSPNVSLTGDNTKLPPTFSLHGGYRFVKEKKGAKLLKYWAPAMNYRHEQKYDQLDVGAYWVHFPLNLGVWYRGLPTKHYKKGYANSDAFCVLVGYDLKDYDMRIGYSYDLPLQRLIGNTTGSHEISVIYEIAKRKNRTRKVLISCPKF